MLVKVLCPDRWPINYLTTYAQGGDEKFAYWGDVCFAFTRDVREADAVAVIHYPGWSETIRVAPQNVFLFQVETPNAPQLFFIRDSRYHRGFAKVFTPMPLRADGSYVETHSAMGWYVKTNYKEARNPAGLRNSYGFLRGHRLELEEKRHRMSAVASNLRQLPGHRARYEFIERLKRRFRGEIDFFGTGFHFLPDKWDGLYPYRYSIAIENDVARNYWTEKIMDCYLAYTIPIYYGCPNIRDFFSPESYIPIDIAKPESAEETIAQCLKDPGDYERRLPYILEARNAVLEKYSLVPYLGACIKRHYQADARKRDVTLYRFNLPWWRRASDLNIARDTARKLLLRVVPAAGRSAARRLLRSIVRAANP